MFSGLSPKTGSWESPTFSSWHSRLASTSNAGTPNPKVADFACGSGVFLVRTLRRLVSRRIASGEKLTRKLIRDTLYNQIFGVDILGGAIHVAAVSLYLAALELDPGPGIGNGTKFLPLVYPKRDAAAQRERSFFNLFEDDAFDPTAEFSHQMPFANKQMAVVVGNPPWTRPAGARSEKLGNVPPETPQHVTYCRERGIRLPNQDPPDQAFFWRAADFALPDARFGLILSGRRFFSHDNDSRAAKRDLLLRFAPQVMINLSELRLESVFPTSLHPAMIVIARNERAARGQDCTYASVERIRTFKNHGVLEIGPESIKRISIFRAAHEDYFPKTASWGTARDAALIRHLSQFAALDEFLLKRGVRPRQGFIRGDEDKRIRPVPGEIVGWPCLETEGLTPFGMTASGLSVLSDEWMQWPREADIYRGPLFLTLATYYIFLTSSVWGVERDDVIWADLRRLPVPPLELTGDRGDRVVRISEQLRDAASRQSPISPTQSERLNEAVAEVYGLKPHHIHLMKDMLATTIDLRRRGPRSSALDRPEAHVLTNYARQFIQVIDQFLSVRKQQKTTGEAFELPEDCPLQVVKFSLVPRSSRDEQVKLVAQRELTPLLQRIAQNLPEEISLGVYSRRHARIYGPGVVYIIKPAQLRFWTSSAGMNDADAVLAEHLGRAT